MSALRVGEAMAQLTFPFLDPTPAQKNRTRPRQTTTRPSHPTNGIGPIFSFPLESENKASLPSLRGQSRVEAKHRGTLGPKVVVTLTANRSIMISFRHRRGVL